MEQSPSQNAAVHPPADLRIESGTCFALFAYDLGLAIDLDKAEQLITTNKQRETIKHKRRAPRSFQYHPPPLRVTQAAEPVVLGNYRTAGSVDVILYDFGAMSVVYGIPLRGSFSGLKTLSNDLYDNERLLDDSRRRVVELAAALREAVRKPRIADFIEDYAIFQIDACATPYDIPQLLAAQGRELAQILRAERAALSEEEVRDALACRASFGLDDATIIDWNAALVLDRDADDVRTVLEFANVELLEMRFLDHQLDTDLNQAYEALSKRLWPKRLLLGSHAADVRRVARLQADNAILFEGVNNALKLVGDQYLARIYRLASQRFHLAEWDASILRKLQTLESIYGKITDEQTVRRMEILEWIIIILFIISIVTPFLMGPAKH